MSNAVKSTKINDFDEQLFEFDSDAAQLLITLQTLLGDEEPLIAQYQENITALRQKIKQRAHYEREY